MTQISNMKVIGLMVGFLKIDKLWRLSTEFYDVWQLHPREMVYRTMKSPPLHLQYYALCSSCHFRNVSESSPAAQWHRGSSRGG